MVEAARTIDLTVIDYRTAPQMQLKNAVISMEVSFTVTENIDDATCRLNFTLVGPAQFYNSSDPRYWGVSFTQNTYFEFGLYPLLGSTVFIRCISKANGVMVNVSVKNGEVPCKPGLNQFLLAPYGRNQFIFYWEGTLLLPSLCDEQNTHVEVEVV